MPGFAITVPPVIIRPILCWVDDHPVLVRVLLATAVVGAGYWMYKKITK